MERRFDLVAILSAVWIAGYAAIALGYVAHYDFGWSRIQIRDGAIVIAILLMALVALDFWGKHTATKKPLN